MRSHPDWLVWLKGRWNASNPAWDLDTDWKAYLEEGSSGGDRNAALRAFNRRATIEIAFLDITGLASFEETVARLSRLAEWSISTALEACWTELLPKLPASLQPGEGFAVFALGKLGAKELNYSSDVDLVFCRRTADDEHEARFFTRLGERLVEVLGRHGPEGFLYRVDMRLRPLGGTGPLVPTIESLENYYESWGEAWERQALIKLRPLCGAGELSSHFGNFAARFVFARQISDSSLEEIKRVKYRSEKEHAVPGSRVNIKQGPGGIRDIEFYVQYLQLIAGCSHPEVRVAATLDAINALGAVKALLTGEESQLALAYLFLRGVEHRLQLRTMRPDTMIPDNDRELENLASGLGFGPKSQRAAVAFTSVLRGHLARVRAILERIYLTPGHLRPGETEEAFAQLLSDRMPKERAHDLLRPYGFKDTDKAWQNIRLMALGPAGRLLPPGERRAFLEIVCPVLEVLRESHDPDQALHNLESFAAASGNRVSFLRALASRRPHLARLANMLAISNLGHKILTRHPEYFDALARGIHLHEGRQKQEMLPELEGRLGDASPEEQGNVLRRYRQREMIRIAYRDLANLATPMEISAELSELAEATLHAAMNLVAEGPFPLWVIALGKLGRRQLHYASDLDLLFLYQDPPADFGPAQRTELQLMQDGRVERLLELLAGVSPEGTAYKVDLRLRPEGQSGLLTRTWSSFLEHAQRYMLPAERMALVHGRILTDSPEMLTRWSNVLSETVYAAKWDEDALNAVRHLKRRIENELNKESRTYVDFKFGRGGIADLEFLVELLQILHGRGNPSIQAQDVGQVIPALRDGRAILSHECLQLIEALRFQRHVENHYQLMEEWVSREISRESPKLESLARSLGYRQDARRAFLADWDQHAGNVREMVCKYFYNNALDR